MALPKVQHSTYPVTLPSSGEKIHFRPFTVKEENLLLLAKQEEDNQRAIHAVKQVIENCTEGQVDADKLTSFDVEYLFILIRSKSVGETVQLQIKCPECDSESPAMVNLEEVEVVRNENHTKTIMLDDRVGVQMAYPTLKLSEDLSSANLDENNIDPRDAYKAMATCIESIFDEEDVYPTSQVEEKELLDWIEGLSRLQRDEIVRFFNTMPYIKVDVKYNCEQCGKDQVKEITGLQNFFG